MPPGRSPATARIGVLAICCLSLFIVGLDITVVNVALPSIGAETCTPASPACSGRSTPTRSCWRACCMLLGLDGGPVRPQAHLRHRPGGVLARVAAVQPGAERRAARGVPRAAGGRRVDAQPGRDVDRHQHVHRPARAGAGGRRLGRRVRRLDGARAGRRRDRWSPRSAGGRSSGSTSRRARSRSSSRCASSPSPGRRGRAASTRVGQALVIVLLSTLTFGIIEAPSRGWTSPVIVTALTRRRRRWSACCATSRAARSRSSTCASSARSRSRPRSPSRWPRSPRSAGSCS